MKHHYMHISRTCVRIELIAEDNEERILLQEISETNPNNEILDGLFKNALNIYNREAILSSRTFMDFPRVALCNFSLAESHLNVEMSNY